MPLASLAEKTSLVSSSDYAILKTLIELRDLYEYVPKSVIKDRLGFTSKELDVALVKLEGLRLISRERIKGEISYRLSFSGIDVVATKSLYAKGVVKSLGDVIGEGKESIVYYGYDFNYNVIVVKFHRVGRTSYRNARKLRGYTERKNWVSVTLDNAKREYEALECVNKNMGSVPRPLGLAYNGVASEFVEGNKLIYANLSSPKEVLDVILGTIRIAFNYCDGLVHGDLSPYNVIVDNSEKPYVIDWPQWQRHNNELLRRDLLNILDFFRKKYRIEYDLDQAIEYVSGGP
ncbi:MAG: serine/threonine protein kinase [Candidatus Aramenus sp.]|jgi:RIO kinase 2|nr:serine/threonine protein kinase [Candidatus Aramenus sp.]